ncbi:MAG: glycosyltransferase N-terminal domain-containing protein, partial [Nitrospinaceae bacterium]
MIFLYHITSILAAVAIIPCFAIASLFSKHKFANLFQHFGFVPQIIKGPDKKTLWVHALSMGEVNAAQPVLKQIHKERPDIRIAVSVTTDSGYESAQRNLPFAEQIFFHPLDCLPFSLLALARVQPDLFVVTDTGLWPGFLNLLKQRKVPALLINGRMSKKSFRRYKMLGTLMTKTLNSFNLLCMQNEQGAQAMRDLGVQAEKT